MGLPQAQQTFLTRMLAWLPLGPLGRRLLWALLLFAGTAVVLGWALIPQQVDLRAGDVAAMDIVAPRETVDRPATRALQDAAAQAVGPQYAQDPTVAPAVEADLAAAFEAIRTVKAEHAEDPGAGVARLRDTLGLEVADGDLAALIRADGETLTALEGAVKGVMAKVFSRGVKDDPDSLRLAEEQIAVEMANLNLRREYERVLVALARGALEPNEFYSPAETAKRQAEARRAVEPVIIPKGKVIVRKGDVVSAEDLERLADLGLLRSEADWRRPAGAGLMAAIIVGLLALYAAFLRRDLLASDAGMVAFSAIYVGTLVLGKLLAPVSGFLVPVAAGSMLVTSLLDGRVGLIFSILAGLPVGLIAGATAPAVVAVVGGMIGVFGLVRVGGRIDITRAGAYVGLANAAAIIALRLLEGPAPAAQPVWFDAAVGLANGLFCGVLTLGSLHPLEAAFGIITPVKLLELANPNQPLLKKLLLEAPGTYHHTIMVANLTESAVEALGGDSLLARVGAYYHDVGKTRRPYFFVENQFGDESPHDKISPHLSALIIKAHVKDGVEMAQEHRLPPRIIDFIREHHGTTLVGYFYARATEDGDPEHILEADFRYDGPKPRSRETAVCMLADACESAVRTINRPSPGRIEALVRKIIRDRLNDGQLDEADLTFRDLDVICRTFTSILSGVFHARVEYPETVLKEIREAKKAVAGRERAQAHAQAQAQARKEAAELPVPGPAGERAQASRGGDPPT